MSKSHEQLGQEINYKDTLNLPRTEFPIRAQAHIFDPQILQRWQDENLYAQSYEHNKGKEKFILHDGPPYANGNIHIGHAYNKILKDIVTKSERMAGKHVPVTPGWDCHGLPIELKVVKDHSTEDKSAFKKACRSYAQQWIDTQREEFKQLGVVMNWDKPYLTMDFTYEAAIMRALGKFVEGGYITKKMKTVPWCASCKTVLANAEIEYQDRKDPSIYVQFPFSQHISEKLFPEAQGRQVSLLIWTTTPWTLPLNRAVVIKPGATYQCVEIDGKLVVLGKDLVAKVAEGMQKEYVVVAEFTAEHILETKVNHPFVENLQVPVIADQFVSLEDGTACVHSAPGCGPEDYEIGLKNNLEIYSPISVDGKYTQEIAPQELAGMPVSDGQIWVIKKLVQLDKMLFKKSIRHSYPHCWRCQNGLIFRATTQWFCDLSQHGLKDRALGAIEKMRMIPQTGRNRLSATVQGRLEWCLSRQRIWGVPIPGIICQDCENVHLTAALVEKVAKGVEQCGVEYWDEVSLQDLLGPDFACQKCDGKNLKKEHDILDVWFDSGVSNYAVLDTDEHQQYPADMYLEGKDQHRGWFQSSLLASLVLHDQPAMKEILTHGFTVDEKGYKMSKSRGNVVSPAQVIKRLGTDGLRLWVASNDYDSDPVVSDALFNNVAEVYRKIRNTCRFMLSNLYDFDNSRDLIAPQDLLQVDQYALYKINEMNTKIQQAYKDRKTTAVFHELADYCVKDLSSFYLDVVKDRLYVEKADGLPRRSAQTVCFYILDTLTKLMAPVLSFTSELLSDHYQVNKTSSIHLQEFNELQSLVQSSQFNSSLWKHVFEIRSAVLKELEKLRGQGEIKHSLDGAVMLYVSKDFAGYESIKQLVNQIESKGQSTVDFFKELFIVSQFELCHDASDLDQVSPGLFIKAQVAQGDKCKRCWQWDATGYNENKMLCARCSVVVG